MNDSKLYSVLITYKDETYDENGQLESSTEKSIFLDAVDSTSIDESSDITTHPIVNGDMIGDHMIKQPASIQISGTISKNGSGNIYVHSAMKSAIELARPLTINSLSFAEIEKMFSDIKSKGTLCDVWKMSVNQEFGQWSNMALSSIHWQENMNSLDFRFTFTQVFIVDIEETDVTQDEKEMLLQDSNLPDITEPVVLSLGQFANGSIFDIDYVCWKAGASTQEFYLHVHQKSKEDVIANIQRNTPTSTQSSSNMTVGEALQHGFDEFTNTLDSVVDWVLFKFNPINLAYNAISAATANKSTAQFSDWQSTSELDRYFKFKEDIYSKISSLNSQMFTYTITENVPQQCTLTINGTQYDFIFKRNNVAESWMLNVNKSLTNIEVLGLTALYSAKTSISECTDSNAIFVTDSGSYVYIAYIPQKQIYIDDTDLRNFGIFVSARNPQEIMTEVESIIKAELHY